MATLDVGAYEFGGEGEVPPAGPKGTMSYNTSLWPYGVSGRQHSFVAKTHPTDPVPKGVMGVDINLSTIAIPGIRYNVTEESPKEPPVPRQVGQLTTISVMGIPGRRYAVGEEAIVSGRPDSTQGAAKKISLKDRQLYILRQQDEEILEVLPILLNLMENN